MRILASWYFVSELRKLTKKKYKGAYGNLMADLGAFFESHRDLDTISKVGDTVTHLAYEDNNRPTKIRINNSTMKSGKSGGYRSIIVLVVEEDAVVLIDIYPKTGPLGKSKPSQSEWVEVLESYLNDDLYDVQIQGGSLEVQIEEDAVVEV